MKKFTRIFSLALAVTVCALAFANTVVFAAGYTEGEMGEPVFLYGEITPTVVQQCKDSFRYENGGSVYYYGNNRTPETWENETMFTSGYTYKQMGGGGNAYDNNYLQFNFNTSSLIGSDYTIAVNDIIYFSFYYKSASEFDFDGTTVSGTDNAAISIKLGGNNAKGYGMFNLNTPDSNTGNKRATNSIYTKADDSWHKVEMGLMVPDGLTDDGTTDNQKTNILQTNNIRVTMDFNNLANAHQTQLSGFSVGLMQFDSEKTAEADITPVRGLEYLCRTLEAKTADAKAIASDGFITNTATDSETGEKIYDYTVTASSETPVIEATDKSNGSFKTLLTTEYEKKADGTINANVYAPAYDKTAAADSTASYITFSDLSSTTKPGSVGVGCTKRGSSVNNGAYAETYNLNTQKEYKIFKPTQVAHNTPAAARGKTVEYTANIRAEEKLSDDIFSGAYSIQLLKSEDSSAVASNDNHYLQFNFGSNKYAEQYDILLYSFYIKVESESGMTGSFKPKLTVIGTGDGTTTTTNQGRTQIYDGTNSYLILIDDYQRSFAPGSGWQKVIIQLNACGSSDQWLRVGVTADGTTDYKISVAEPRAAIIKLPSKTMPEVEKITNNVRRRIGSVYAAKNDITGVSVGENVTAVASDTTELEVTGRNIKESDISVISPYGDMPYLVTKNSDGTFTIKVKGIAYNPVSGDDVNQTHFNRTVTQYTYSDGSTTTAFDYEKHILTPVTSVTTNSNSKTVRNGSMARSLIVTGLTSGIDVTFSKDGADAVGNLTSAEDGSVYTFKIECSDFPDGMEIILAAYDSETKLIKAGLGTFADGAGTAALQGIVNLDNSVRFKVFVWDTENGFKPITNAVEINENTIELPEIVDIR